MRRLRWLLIVAGFTLFSVAFCFAQTAVYAASGEASIQDEVTAFTQANAASGVVIQVDLAWLAKVSQYTDIDSSAWGFGMNACGLVAAAASVGGAHWVPLVGTIAQAAGPAYGPNTGIQPSEYVTALRQVFGAKNVQALNESSLDKLYQELQAGNIVIVDLQVSAATEFPSASAPNYAHFARVLGIDVSKGQINIQNTLSGPAYWTLSLDQFLRDWERPETTASLVPDPAHAENVTHWAVILDRVLVDNAN